MIEIILGKPGSEQHRSRLGFILLALGLLLMLWAWGSWIFRESVPARAQVIVRTQSASGVDSSHSDSDAANTRAEAAQALPLALAVSLVLALLVLFGSYALVRAARRYRAALDRQRAAPSDTTDIWAMHKLPEGAEDDLE